MNSFVLLRHGESLWNKENRFTGWTDIDLSENGINEAISAAKSLKQNGFIFDIAFTSVLKRAIHTLWTVLDELDIAWIPQFASWRLNERHYGALQGLNKDEIAAKYGEDKLLEWRRSYNTRPPELEITDPRYPINDSKYNNIDRKDIPLAESLKDTLERVLPFWNSNIYPEIKSGKKVIISAHGNSLRALVKHLNNISDDDVVELNIPTGKPLVFELEENCIVKNHYFL